MDEKNDNLDERPEIITNLPIISEHTVDQEPISKTDTKSNDSTIVDLAKNNIVLLNENVDHDGLQVENFITETLKNHFEPNETLDQKMLIDDSNKLKVFQPKSDEMFKDFFKNAPNLRSELNEIAVKRKSRYTFDFDSFLDVFNEQEQLVDPQIFAFVSFSISQLVDIFYKDKSKVKFKENLKKTLSNIFYSLLEEKLVNLFNNQAYSFPKKCVLALVQLVSVWNMYVDSDDNDKKKRSLKDDGGHDVVEDNDDDGENNDENNLAKKRKLFG